MNIMNMLEKHKLLNRIPREKRADLKMVMNRSHFYEVRDTGNEQYVLNVVNQDCVVDKIETEGHLYLMCATSRFEMKMLRYQMKFGEKNEIIVLKSKDSNLTSAEEVAWDRYIAEFCGIIKRELDYQIEYRSETIEEETAPVVTNAEVKMEAPVANTVNAKTSIPKVDHPLAPIYDAIAQSGEQNVTLIAYARNGEIGVGVDAGLKTVANIKTEVRVALKDEDVARAMYSSVKLAESIGSYVKLKNASIDIKLVLFKDRDVYIEMPKDFEIISTEELAQAKN